MVGADAEFVLGCIVVGRVGRLNVRDFVEADGAMRTNTAGGDVAGLVAEDVALWITLAQKTNLRKI